MTGLLERVLEMSVTAAAVIAVILIIRLPLRKAPRKYSYLLWSAPAFRLMCPTSFRAEFSIFRLERKLGDTTALFDPSPAVSTLPGGFSAGTVIAPTTPFEPEQVFTYPAITPITTPDPTQTFLRTATVVWLIGAAALVIYGIVSYARQYRRMSTAVRLEGNVWQSDRVRSPFILGLFRPKIYIPFGLTEEQLRYVLAHERYHVKRLDHAARLLAFSLLAVHWFNPFVWLAYYLMSRDMEMSCDEKVLAGEENIRRAYSTMLLAFAANRRFPTPCPPAFGESGVKRRVKNALSWKKPRLWVSILAVAVCVAVITACAADPSEPAGHPHDWAGSVTASEVDYAELYRPEGTPQVRRLSAEELETLLLRLNQVDQTQYSKTPEDPWAFPTESMVSFVCGEGGYILNLGTSAMTIYNATEGDGWNGCSYWFVNSDALKQAIRSLPQGEADPAPAPSAHTEMLNTLYADVTHDGTEETIVLRYDAETMVYLLSVETAEGKVIWQAEGSTVHTGYMGYYLYEENGLSYLLRWNPACWGGSYAYSYEIFTLNEVGEEHVLREKSFCFETGSSDQILAIDVEGLRALEADLNTLLARSIVLIDTNDGTVLYSTAEHAFTKQWTATSEHWAQMQQRVRQEQEQSLSNTLAVWTADVSPADGNEKIVVRDQSALLGDLCYTIEVRDKNDYLLWTSQQLTRFSGTLFYLLYEEGGTEYIAEFSDESSQGVILWSYRIFSLLPEGITILRENTLSCDTVGHDALMAADPDQLAAFEAEVNSTFRDAAPIAFAANGKVSYAPRRDSAVFTWSSGQAERIRELQEMDRSQ